MGRPLADRREAEPVLVGGRVQRQVHERLGAFEFRLARRLHDGRRLPRLIAAVHLQPVGLLRPDRGGHAQTVPRLRRPGVAGHLDVIRPRPPALQTDLLGVAVARRCGR